jgi:hypothetical protein
MKKYNSDFEKLSAYIDGELPLSEKNELEQKLSTSPELKKKLDELRKLKELTTASYDRIPESPYFDTRVMAHLKTSASPFFRRKWIPVAGLAVFTIVLMMVLKFNPNIINRLVEEQTVNIASFYKENLKPLLYASNLSNEDIFNFAFNKELPLDNNKDQYLQIGHDDKGNEYFEIKKSAYDTDDNNYEKFVSALNLNEIQKSHIDSILQHYAAELQDQVLVSDRNIVAINPNIWNYNTAIAADLIKFASEVNEPEMRKILPASFHYIHSPDMEKMIYEVKANSDNNYIFLTPDTIFTSWVDVDSKELKIELEKAKKEISRANREISRVFADQRVLSRDIYSIKFDSLKHGRHNKYNRNNFEVYTDNNNYRVVLPDVNIPEIHIPDMDSISANIRKAMKTVQVFTSTLPKDPGKISKRYNFQYEFEDTLNQLIIPPIPDMDSLMRQGFYYYNYNNNQIDSALSLYMPHFKFRQDSLTSYFRLYQDSGKYLYESELQNQLKDMEIEMRKFREEMQNFRKELKKENKEEKSKPVLKPIEI